MKDRELQIKGEMLTCKHFNGIQHDECRANVNYRKLAGEPALGCMTRIPCSFGFEPKNGPRAVCDKRDSWTKEEATALVDAHEAAITRTMGAFRKVHDDAKRKGFKKNHGGTSECKCPVCEGTLRYSVADYNGHIDAKCETKDCVQWME